MFWNEDVDIPSDTIYEWGVPEDTILPDEAKSLEAAQRDRANGDTFSHAEVWA